MLRLFSSASFSIIIYISGTSLDFYQKTSVMKRLLLFVFVCTSLGLVSNAQGVRLGLKAGANLNKISGQAFDEGYDLGYHLGAFSEIDFNKSFGIQPEVMFNQVNTKRASGSDAVVNNWQTNTSDIQLNYLSIPVLLRINVNNILSLNLGPQFSILMNKNESLWNNGKQAVKSGDLAVVGGATINLKALRVYGRYNIGVNNISDIENTGSWKSQQLQLGVGLRL